MQAPMSIEEMQAQAENPLDVNLDKYIDNAEHDAKLDVDVIKDEFAAIREARKKQADAIELANDTEFWFCVFFQTREQKEAYCKAMGYEHDKYIDGEAEAHRQGIALPERPAPYKIGLVDKKLANLT